MCAFLIPHRKCKHRCSLFARDAVSNNQVRPPVIRTLELHRSVIGEDHTAALPDLLRYSDIKDELPHVLSVGPFIVIPHEAHTLFTVSCAAVRINVGGLRTQPCGDQLLSERTHCWRGKPSSHSMFWW